MTDEAETDKVKVLAMTEATGALFAGGCLSLLVQGYVFSRESAFQRQNAEQRAAALATSRLISRAAIATSDLVLCGLLVVVDLEILAGGANWLGSGLFVVAVVILRAALHRLLHAGQQFGAERKLGQSVISPGLYLKDTLVQGGLILLVAIPLALFSLLALNTFGPGGWGLVAAFWVCFSFLRTRFYPTVIGPMFNRFTPLDDDHLKAAISRRAEQAGCRLDSIQVMDGSKRSSHGNARVEGVVGGKRIILLDILFDLLERSEIIAVIAHELGHIRQHHIAKYELILALIRLSWIIATGYIVLDNLSPAIALGILWLASPLWAFFLSPWISALLRGYEHQADAFIVSTGDGEALLSALNKLNAQNLACLQSDPGFRFFFHSHPEYQERERRILGISGTAASA